MDGVVMGGRKIAVELATHDSPARQQRSPSTSSSLRARPPPTSFRSSRARAPILTTHPGRCCKSWWTARRRVSSTIPN
ncbi:hypothetical protein M885DRAFT_525664, partial [Pelagophyceae sp. CCMP2097]